MNETKKRGRPKNQSTIEKERQDDLLSELRKVAPITEEEKEFQIQTVSNLQKGFEVKAAEELSELQKIAITQGNLFERLMESVKYCSLGQITSTLFNVGGQYRRNM